MPSEALTRTLPPAPCNLLNHSLLAFGRWQAIIRVGDSPSAAIRSDTVGDLNIRLVVNLIVETKKAPKRLICIDQWRSRRDSNPRWVLPHARFPGV